MAADPGAPVYFLSDLHLADLEQPATRLFLDWLEGPARQARALYILGDLFEAWIGDDDPDPLAEAVAEALARLADEGVQVYFQHGNRDFLIGSDYARRARFKLLPERHLIELAGERCLLLHGDQLCTGDQEYQRWRALCRSPEWQRAFLARPLAERRTKAARAREESRRHQRRLLPALADVELGAVLAAFAETGARRIIHGHTHRPAWHGYPTAAGVRERIVLGDWGERGCVLRAGREGFTLELL